WDIFVRDRQSGSTEFVPVGGRLDPFHGKSYAPSISADGRFIAFASDANNPVQSDVFVWDRQVGQTERVSVTTGGASANDASWSPSISADGRFIAFQSSAD